MEKGDMDQVPEYDLKDFQLNRILHNNVSRKYCALLGLFPQISSAKKAIILLEKTAFHEDDVQTSICEDDNGETSVDTDCDSSLKRRPSYFGGQLSIQTEFINNIYGSFICIPEKELNKIKITVIYPATERHIEKYSIKEKILITETPVQYKEITLPSIEKNLSSLEWVYNILEHKQEVERIVYEDTDEENGFILLPDLKWEGKNVDNLYLLVIIRKRGIKSIRDLRGEHLSLLKNIRSSAARAIDDIYNIETKCLRMYFHYQPYFYHLHVHINLLRNDAPGIWCEKSHLLETVINNIELYPEYYKNATMTYALQQGSDLLSLFESHCLLRKRVNDDLPNSNILSKKRKA